MLVDAVQSNQCIPYFHAVVHKFNRSYDVGVPFNGLCNSFYGCSAIQIEIRVVNNRGLLLSYYLAGSRNDIQFFALFKVSEARVNKRILLRVEVFEFPFAFVQFPKLVFSFTAN